MYVVTFYSYKGGVGRTMALVNTAVELATNGRKVLIVDFDLEAPGISTYSPFTSLTMSPGIVEYVSEYVRTAQAPPAADYIQECKVNTSSIWVLPAGTRDVGYSTLLHSIDWNVLYTRFHGYELFEDLKQQWAQQGFDYVLIDSRTGYTDVGGICTRHLPDAVVLMFFPNDQNLLGLETIAKEIRGEASGQDARNIVLHFCASNVPDLDDEDYILERKMKDATRLLKLKGSPVIIHHYNSLALLEQSIFVQDRPKSKLATEYRELVKTIISDNLKDREGALLKLESLLQREAIIGRDANDQEITSTLARVREFHPNDGEVNLAVAEMYYRLGDFEDELESLEVAISQGYKTNAARLRRAEIARLQGGDAISDLQAVITSPNSKDYEFTKAVQLLRAADRKNWISTVAQAPFDHLKPGTQLRLAEQLLSDNRGEALVSNLLERVRIATEADPPAKILKGPLILSQIGAGQFEAARNEFNLSRSQVLESNVIQDVFNYAMVEWALVGSPPKDLMKHVLEIASTTTKYKTSNFYQCIALAHAICDERDAAREALHRARTTLRHTKQRTEFSCWRYREVPIRVLQEDLDDVERFINGENVHPLFLRQNRKLLPINNA